MSPVIILGMHRSGTSVTGRVLEAMGGNYCTEESGLRLPANQFNPSGFFERRDVVEANNRILSSAGGSWDHPECLNFASVSVEDQQRFSDSVAKIASDLTTLSPAFVKDPRFCLTLNLWLPHFDRPIVVLPYRHPIAVAKSLRSRDGFPLSFGIALWELHMIRALESARALPTLVIGFESILAQASGTVTRLDAFFRRHRLGDFSIPSTATLESLVDSTLSHHSVGEGDPPLDGKVMAIYDLLRKAERTGELPPRIPDLSENSRTELSRFHQFSSAAEERLRKSEERARGLARMLKQIDVKLDATAASKRFSGRRLKAALQLFRTGQLREARRWQERYRNELSAVEVPRRNHDDDGTGSQVATRFRSQHDPASPFRGRWPDSVCPARSASHHEAKSLNMIGAFAGEGVGAELVSLSLEIVGAAAQRCGCHLEVRHGGPIGSDAVAAEGKPLTDTAIEFCQDIFAAGGAVLTGPGSGRFVYDLRERFDLYCKVNPIEALPELAGAAAVRPEVAAGTNLLVVRENSSGLYHARNEERRDGSGIRSLYTTFSYSEPDVHRIIAAGARLAQQRSGRLAVIYKDSGLPEMSAFWKDIALEAAANEGCSELRFIDIDFAIYSLATDPGGFDVVVAPNCFGDIVSDLGGALMGSRGMTWGASYSPSGSAVYQTNHGAAYDLVGTDRANPLGQILGAAGMLRHSFGYDAAADLVETAVRTVLRRGIRTADIAESGSKIVGTREMGEHILKTILA